MAIYTLSDPHLSLEAKKPMDVFGGRWTDYTEKLKTNLARLSEDDTLVIPGDVSWAMKLSELDADMGLLNSLPGMKIIGKGNHDYWWNTMNKLEEYRKEKGFDKIRFLFNNAYVCEDSVICGSRGWYLDAEVSGADNRKIIARECGRLELSIREGVRLATENGFDTPLVFLHYPAIYGDYRCDEIISVLKAHGIKKCYYGHLHGIDSSRLWESFDGIDFTLCSADHLNFQPILIK